MNRASLRRSVAALFALVSLASVASACSAHTREGDRGTEYVTPEDRFEDPSGVLTDVSRRLDAVVTLADVGKTFETSRENIPHPDTHWSMKTNGIDHRWIGENVPSPLEKYMSVANPSSVDAAREWNRSHQGQGVPNAAPWWGIAHGWVGAAVAESPIRHAIFARQDGEHVSACNAGEPGCVRFEVGDINALEASVYSDGAPAILGLDCEAAQPDYRREESGRMDRRALGPKCAGLDAGSLLVVLSHRVRRDRMPFALESEDLTATTGVFCQPVYAYTVNALEPIDEATAERLAGRTEHTAAKGFARVDVVMHAVAPIGPNAEFVSGVAVSHDVRLVAVIDLDAPFGPHARILGGRYVPGATESATRLTQPAYAWVPRGPGPDSPPLWTRNRHNPYLSTPVIAELVELARR